MAAVKRVLAAGIVRRLSQLVVGLALMGVAATALKRSELGLGPWDVLHDGIATQVGVDLGVVGIALGLPILVLWFPLRQRPGLGTILNVVLIGSVIHRLLPHTSPATTTAGKVGLMTVGMVLFAVGQGLYLAVDMGPGPRDGLMTGLNRRYGVSIRVARTGIELTALAAGMALGGSAGVGTIVFALAIGPMVQVTLRWFGYDATVAGRTAVDALGLAGE